MSVRQVFPFPAIVGQEDIKLALLLNAISPAIGGVLIRGHKGTAKSTAVRALSRILPDLEVVTNCPFMCDPTSEPESCPYCATVSIARQATIRPARLVELPLGVTEDRVAGTLDIERALKSGEKHFEPGLLAAAHRGMLYIDEVNLLSDHIVDILLDAAAMGVNYVEREGVSISHASAFILVGTMNPEEGELRPQLLDRFGLAVDVQAAHDIDMRTEVVRRRIAFDEHPGAFQQQWAEAERAEQLRLLDARRLLPDVCLSDDLLKMIAGICNDFGVDGMRADIVMYRAAVALAAYEGRTDVSEADIRRVAPLVLPHRRRRQPFDEPTVDDQELEDSIDRHRPNPPESSSPPESDTSSDSHDAEGEGTPEPDGQGIAPEDKQAPIGQTYAVQPLEGPLQQSAMHRATGRRSRKLGGRSGHYVTSRQPQDRVRDIAIDATLRAAAPHLYERRQTEANPVLIRSADLREKVRESRGGNLILFAVDASGSMGARDRMIATKGAIMSLLLDAYQKRDQVGMISFRGQTASILLPPTSSVELAQQYLTNMATGGRTPLAAGLAKVQELLARSRHRDRDLQPLLVLLTDGRANASLGSDDPVADSLRQASALWQAKIPALVVDTEQGVLRLGLAQRLAQALGGICLRLEELAATTLAKAVRLSMVG
jgi:magnesium chelatase subunit D